MEKPRGTTAGPREWLIVSLLGIALAIAMTWPVITGLGHLGRTRGVDADGEFSIWNVSWVARTLVADPANLFNANIFYPHRRTLAYSEANVLEGVLGIPAYWLTRNPWATLNIVMLFGFASAYVCGFLLLRYLCGDGRAAAVGAILYAFCPFVFAHLSHIQLLMTGGLPLSLLMFHRLSDRPSPGRGVALGASLAAQALACGYYGIFGGLMVGYATLVIAARRRLFLSPAYWIAIATAVAASGLIVLPFFLAFLHVQREMAFSRTLADSVHYSANPQSYLASSARAHAWILDYASRYDRWVEVLFPGLSALVFGAAGVVVAARAPVDDRRLGEIAWLYGSLGLVALWASFGPGAGLYRVLYYLPGFSFLRAPARIGLIVVLCLMVLASLAIARLLAAVPARWRTAAALVLGIAAAGELTVGPIPVYEAPVVPAAYGVLAKLPRAPVAEFPFYGERIAFPLHAQYMVFSTFHWMPLVNGYSDVIPDDFRQAAIVLDSFPSTDAFAVLAHHRVRYITIHWDMFGPRQEEIRNRLRPFAANLRMLATDERMTLYEVVSYP